MCAGEAWRIELRALRESVRCLCKLVELIHGTNLVYWVIVHCLSSISVTDIKIFAIFYVSGVHDGSIYGFLILNVRQDFKLRSVGFLAVGLVKPSVLL